MGAFRPIKDTLDHLLRLAVWAAGVDGGVFSDRYDFGISEEVGGGREDEAADTVVHGRADKVAGVAYFTAAFRPTCSILFAW